MIGLLRAIPLPIRLVVGLLLGVVLARLFGNLPTALLSLAILAWLLVLTGLAYEAGWLGRAGQLAVVGPALDRLVNRQARIATSAPVPAARPQQLSAADRERVLGEAYRELDAIVGQEQAKASIDLKLLEPARQSTEGHPSFGTRAPALFIGVRGPLGTDLRRMARAIGRAYVGLGALAKDKIVVLASRDARPGKDQVEAVRKKAEEAVGGVLLLEDADWLLEGDGYGGNSKPGVEAGVALLDVAVAHHQQMVIVATFAEAAEERLRGDADHARWMGQLAVRWVALQHLEEEELFALLHKELAAIGLQLDADAERPARALLRDVRETMGRNFDNSDACRRIAEQLGAIAAELATQEPASASQGGNRSITARHVRLVSDSWE